MSGSLNLSRRKFLMRVPLAAAAGAALPDTIRCADQISPPDFCLFLADHWSYTGIGWSSGLKSCAQSIENCIQMADYDPSVKTGVNLDARAYELVAEEYPDIAERLKQYLRAGKVEIIGGTYGQPMGSMCSGESNLRQLVFGQQAIQKSLGVLASSFLEEEECTHPQLPQLLKGAGYRFASTAQCDTWGNAGNPLMPLNVFEWCAPDGTSILATPNNGLRFHPPVVTHDIDWLWSEAGRDQLKVLQRSGTPLAVKWVEFGWGKDELEGKTANKFYASMFRRLSKEYRVRYTTLTEYLTEYGNQSSGRVRWSMDDFHKLDPWGVGGDQLRREGRATEAVLAAAERFDAVAEALRLSVGRASELQEAWKHLLVAQSHDVSLCEHWVDESAPAGQSWLSDPGVKDFLAATGTPEDNRKVNTWGALGFRHLSVSRKMAQKILANATAEISAAVDTANASQGDLAMVVFNAGGAPRDAIAETGRFELKIDTAETVVVRDAQGTVVPSQVLGLERDESRNVTAAELAFETRHLPALGYSTYYVTKSNSGEISPDIELKTSQTGFHIENASLSLDIDNTTGAITKLTDRRNGNDVINGGTGGFPFYTGRPNRSYPGAEALPEAFDSRQSQAEVAWVERGPIRAIVKSVHAWPKLKFEHWVTVAKGLPYVDVRVRLQADVPPPPGEGKINGWQFPLEILEGYWLSFAPAFKVETVVRDFPFGVETCHKDAIDALTFVDLVGARGGLLIVHGGTQYFKRLPDGTFCNLLLREWNSHFVANQYGWPRAAEYNYRLLAHGNELNNAYRLRSAEAFDHDPICVVESPHGGRLAKQRSFSSVEGRGVLISSLRGVGNGVYEVRLIEQDGVAASAQVRLDLPLKKVVACDFLGRTAEEPRPVGKGILNASLGAWQVRTYRLIS